MKTIVYECMDSTWKHTDQFIAFLIETVHVTDKDGNRTGETFERRLPLAFHASSDDAACRGILALWEGEKAKEAEIKERGRALGKSRRKEPA